MIKALYKPVILLALSIVIQNCSKSDNYDSNCNNLLNLGIQTSLNLNLAQYNQLTFPSNPVYVPNEGNGGLIVNNTGTGYVAFDAADPNIPFGECSILTISGVDKELVSKVASDIKNLKPVEPYKGKGITEKGQFVLRKEGKKK